MLLFLGDKMSVYCLSSSSDYLFSGGTEGVRTWSWSNITKPNVSFISLSLCFIFILGSDE